MMSSGETGDRSDYFRAGVGGMVIDSAGRILVLKRADVATGGWQMPQGGIRPGEEPEAAFARELGEETGLRPSDLEVLAVCREWLVYELPGRLCRLRGAAERVRPDGVEFTACEWVGATELLRRAAPFRKPVYSRLVAEFSPYLSPAD